LQKTAKNRSYAPALRGQLAALSAIHAEKYDTIVALKSLRSRSDIAQADLNYIRKVSAIPNDQFFHLQWHYSLINLPQAWDITTGTPANGEVIVAVVDTGVFMMHPDLKPNLLATGYDFISSPLVANDGDSIDSDPNDAGDEVTSGGSSFHGTHVAGTIAAASNNTIGIAGVSWGAKIMPIRVLGVGGGTDYDIIQGIFYAAGLPNDSGKLPPRKADIINLSLGGEGYSQSAQNAIKSVRATGTILIAAAGNDSDNTVNYPASYDGVISVGAVDINKRRAPYSNFNSAVDIAAPGGDSSNDLNGDGLPDGVLSTLTNDKGATEYNFYQGTSMATPHVAGVVALMKAVNPGLTPDQLDALIASGSITEDTGNDGATVRNNNFGYGMIDALKAVRAAANVTAAELPPVIKPSASLLDFGVSTSTLQLKIENVGGGNPIITNITRNADATWLAGSATDIDASGFGTYLIRVDRTNLVNAVYRGTIFIHSSSGEITEVAIRMVVGSAPMATNSDAGLHYVLLVDPTTNETLYSSEVSAVGGIYRYQLTDVAPGSYHLFAGSDLDNDYIVCDSGEACGVYPTLGAPVLINVVDKNLTNVDFTTGFQTSLNASQSSTKQTKSLGYRRITTKQAGKK
jgi:serine protease